MEFGRKKGKFYCSRCKAIHADGSSRFCADCGGRLVPADEPRAKSDGIGGMFSKILGKGQPEDVELESIGAESTTQTTDESRSSVQINVPVIRGVSNTTIVPQSESPASPVVEAAGPATAPLSDANARSKVTTELSTGDLVSVTTATPQEASINLSTGPLKFEPLGQQAPLSPEQLARLASTGELKLLIGKKISDRFLVNELLAGGLGRATYTAVDLQTNGKVLVQMFPGEAFDARVDSQVYGEALRNVARFRDADFAVVLGSGRLPDGRVVIISEYVEGNSIAQVIGFAGAFDVNRAARLVRKMADAVNEAHQYGIFHGSLRAENVVLLRPEDLQDKIKIIGLGVALADGEALSSGLPTGADDAYDLAVVAYQMLTGRNPFPSANPGTGGSLGTIVPVRSIRSELPQQVEYVLNKALSRIGAERYSDVRDFGDAFYAALTGGTVAASRTVQKEEESQDDAVRSERIQVKELFAKEPKTERQEAETEQADTFDYISPSWSKAGRVLAGAVMIAVLAGAVYLAYRYQSPVSAPAPTPAAQTQKTESDGPITPRNLEKPADAEVFVNKQSGLSGELARSFVPFQVFYPKDFVKTASKNNFLEVSKMGPEGVPVETFIVTKYLSDGTFSKDKVRFPQLVENSTNEIRGILGPAITPVSQGEVSLQDGRLKAYEVRFQYSGQIKGVDITLWGRRLWIPVQKDDAKFGLVVTLIASNLSQDVKSLQDIGERGALRLMLDSLEPGR